MTTKDKIYSFIDMFIQSVKYIGLIAAVTNIYYYIKTKFLPWSIGDTYSFFKYKIQYLNKAYLPDIFFEHFGYNTYYFCTDVKNPIIIDIGSNIGDTILYFKWLYPESIIYGYEPHPTAFKLLRNNIAKNNLRNVKIYNEAISNKKGFVNLHSTDTNMFNGSSIKNGDIDNRIKSNKVSYKVKTKILSQKEEIKKIKKINLLKMDIEGAEGDVFKNLDDVLVKTEFVILEYHLNIVYKENSLEQIFSKLIEFGFKPNVWNYYRNTTNDTLNNTFIITANKT